MPSGAGRYRFAAAAAAAEAFAGLWDCQGLRQQIDVDVGRVAAIGARPSYARSRALEFILDFCDRNALDSGVQFVILVRA